MVEFFVIAAKGALLPGALILALQLPAGRALLAAMGGLLAGWIVFSGAEAMDRALIGEAILLGLACAAVVLAFSFAWTKTTLLAAHWGAIVAVSLAAGWQTRDALALVAPTDGPTWQSAVILRGLAFGMGFGLVGLWVLWTAPAWQSAPRVVQRSLGALLALLFLLTFGGGLYYLMLRLEWLELTRAGLAFVARLNHHEPHFPYVWLTLGSLPLARWPLRPRAAADDAPLVAQRQARALRQRWAHVTLGVRAAFVALLGLMAWQDVWASRPPRLSDAEPVTLGPDGTIRLPIAPHADGQLHRYAFTTEDGRVVRFFLVNRFDDRTRLGVVFDACMLCGDDGYLQRGSQVICLACGVHIHRPSIGKAGGCNPVPLAHRTEADTVVITREALDEAAQLFSEIVAVSVRDPVSGETLINLEAPFQYEWRGRTYFFTNELHRNAFRDAPQDFVVDGPRRRTRVDGYPSYQ